eukprot:5569387-Prymnesium_polylepis.1
MLRRSVKRREGRALDCAVVGGFGGGGSAGSFGQVSAFRQIGLCLLCFLVAWPMADVVAKGGI